ncbi:hypothetical protein [Streptomyces sp. AK02-01A]|uniref:hypothetical protein n=1 Tax=Streptomyces sp. AK02-01A TaxID=3028648 RepID=UPI0029BBF913|nr:hypothetical protein [Streptomyces sp. AK02-01A]MDX3853364.1 hypothetical protein [Streptomyces sp. AK02-01A]
MKQPEEGALVIDTQRDRLGYVMGHEGPYVQLRPVAGGREWDADPARIRTATDEERLRSVRERTRALNSASSSGVL